MKILRRFKYYGIGFGIGLILSVILFQGRGCEWLPGNRVKGSILRSDLYISDSLNCILNCMEMDSTAFFKWVDEAEVNFGKSETKKKPRIYRLQKEAVKIDFSWMEEADSTNIIYIEPARDCSCSDRSNENLSLIDW